MIRSRIKTILACYHRCMNCTVWNTACSYFLFEISVCIKYYISYFNQNNFSSTPTHFKLTVCNPILRNGSWPLFLSIVFLELGIFQSFFGILRCSSSMICVNNRKFLARYLRYCCGTSSRTISLFSGSYWLFECWKRLLSVVSGA